MFKDAEKHLQLSAQEWSYYRSTIDASKEVVKTTNGHLDVLPFGSRLQPACHNKEMHFNFDMAQQVEHTQLNPYYIQCNALLVHYHSDPQQPGPIHYLTPHKCAIFGVCCEAVPRQVD